MVRFHGLASTALGVALAASALTPVALVHAQAPITLTLASPDPTGRASEDAIRFFVDEVARASGGSITIEPVFEVSSDDPTLPFEQFAAKELTEGHYQLGVIASRGWDQSGITTPWALQAPFLIDNDALAVAVATSDVATEVMDGMSAAGVTGLSLWPEDLRHPFAFVPFGKPFLAPADFVGTTIRAIPSHVGYALLTAMGAEPMFSNDYVKDVADGTIDGAESGLLQGASLPANPTATGNVTFFPKVQVLVANSEAWAQLSDDQRAILQAAAVATRDHAIENRTSEAEASRNWCEGANGRVVWASDDQVAAFQAAAAPVYAELEADATVKAIIADIRDLKAATPAGEPAAPCEPAPRATPPTDVPTSAAQPFPNGTYRAEITPEDLIAKGYPKTRAADNSGTAFLIVEDGMLTIHWDGDSPDNDCHFPTTLVDNVVHVDLSGCADENSLDFQWQQGIDGALTLTVIGVDPSWFYADDAAVWNRTWVRVE